MGSLGFVLGGVIAVLAGILSNYGTNCMKTVHNANEMRPEHERVLHYKQPKWWVAFGLVVLGSVGDFVALGLASQALVAALGGSTTLLANLYIAGKINGEVSEQEDYVGVAFIVAGSALFAILGGSESESSETLSDMERYFTRTSFVTYAVVQIIVIVALLSQVASSVFFTWREKVTNVLLKPFNLRLKMLEKQVELDVAYIQLELLALRNDVDSMKESGKPDQHVSRTASGRTASNRSAHAASNGIATRTDANLKLKEKSDAFQKFKDMARNNWKDQYIYAATSGAVGAVSVLFAGCASKSVIEAIHLSANEKQPFSRPLPYVFVGGMLVAIILQQQLLNMALMHGDIMTVFPVFQAVWITMGVLGGVTFYPQQTFNFNGTVGLFVGGTMLMVCGFVFTCRHGYKHRENGGRAKQAAAPAPEDGAAMGDGGGIELQNVQTTTAAADGDSTSRQKLVSGQSDSQSKLDIVTEDGTDVGNAALGFNPAYSTMALRGKNLSLSPLSHHERRQTMDRLEARIQGLERETQFFARRSGAS